MTALPDVPMPPEAAIDEPPLTDEDLDRYFAASDDGIDPSTAAVMADDLGRARGSGAVDRWRIEDDAAAEWAMRKLALAEAEVRQLAEQSDDWQERITAWYENASKRHRRTVEFMRGRLEDYALRRRDAGGAATLALPSGVVRTTSSNAAVEVDDPAAVADWLDTLEGRLTPEQYQLWHDAAEAADLDLDDVIARQPKVYVGPLRKLVVVVEVPAGRAVVATLACDHTRTETYGPDETDSGPVVGEFIDCIVCEADPIEGPHSWPVKAVEVEELYRLAAVGPDGIEVPGVTVRDAAVTAKATAK